MIWLILAASLTQRGGDIVELRPSSEGHVAEVYYRNSVVQNSMGDETLIVVPMDNQLIAVPDRIDVSDGEETVVQIMRPMF